MNSTASQSSNSRMRRRLGLAVPSPRCVPTRPMPKYACQTRLTNARAVVGELAIDQPAGERRAGSASEPAGSGCRKPGTPGVTGPVRLQEIAARQKVRVARHLARGQHQLRRAVRMLLPEGLDRVVGLFPFGDRGAPVAEDGGNLRRRALVAAGWPECRGRLAAADRPRRSARGDREAEAAEVVVLIVVAVPAAVVLLEIEGQHGARREVRSACRRRRRPCAAVAAAGAGVDAPGRFVFAVDGEVDRAGHAAASALVVEDRRPAAFPAD